MRPSELVREWVARFNAADAGGLAELYADSAGCGFFHVQDGLIVFQRGYWDKLSFLKAHGVAAE
ncbi:MAG TPA: hypothetical protein VGR95_08900 [Thermoanaerobaculia bacterium]|jgi:limonene-1,2-epoxide hydrolase|nr:hypothetical protein [Thermoanaerobaculia bacterium]